MIDADDPTPWDLLHDGRIVAIAQDRLTVALEHLGREVVVRLHGLESLAFVPYGEEAQVTEPEAIVAAKPLIVEAEWDASERTMIVWGSLGSLRLRHASLELEGITIEQLRAEVDGFWQRWRERWQPGGA